MPKVLVADDQVRTRKALNEFLSPRGWTVVDAAEPESARRLIDSTFDAAIIDLNFRTGNKFEGVEILRDIRRRRELDAIPVIVYTIFDTSSKAVETLRLGAYQYIHKNMKNSLAELAKALISGMAWQKAHTLRRQLLTSFSQDNPLDRIYHLLSEVFKTCRAAILLLDETHAITTIIGEGLQELSGSRRRFIEWTATERQPHVLSTADEIRGWEPLMEDSSSLLAVPIFGASGTAGIIVLETPKENAFDRNWVDVVSYLGDLAGLALEIWTKAEQLLAAEREKRKNVENLALEVKHHFSSPIYVIQGQCEQLLLKEVPRLPEEVKNKGEARVRMILDNAKAIEGACRYLESVYEELPLHKESLNIGSLLAVCGEEIRPELETKHIRYSFLANSEDPVALNADPFRIRYSVQCLLKNAVEAIDERRDREFDPEFDPAKSNDEVTLHLETPTPGRVVFTVTDTGVGIPVENQERLFQPLFSTKRRPQKGGVGLFSVKRIIDRHGGRIDFNSEPGKGATFRVSLPTAERPE